MKFHLNVDLEASLQFVVHEFLFLSHQNLLDVMGNAANLLI